MATPAKTVQFRSPEDLVSLYADTGIAPFAIKSGSPQPVFKYEGDEMEAGIDKLKELCKLIIRNKSAAIYSLCLYEDIPGGTITDKTPCGYAWNFRFCEHPEGMGMIPYGSPGEDIRGELASIKKDLQDLKKGKEDDGDKLGVIGEILQMDAVQPLLMGISQKIADWICGDGKVGELKRVSGIPEMQPGLAGLEWSADEKLVSAVTRLYKTTPDLPEILDKLATVSEKNPKKFAFYLGMVKKLQ